VETAGTPPTIAPTHTPARYRYSIPEPAGHSAEGAFENVLPVPGCDPMAPQFDAWRSTLPTSCTGDPSKTRIWFGKSGILGFPDVVWPKQTAAVAGIRIRKPATIETRGERWYNMVALPFGLSSR
jgi:hypothetical protein